MFAFEFARLPDGDTSSFDLGNITVRGTGLAISSAGKTPSQSMMIYLAITDLIEGTCQLCAGSRRVFEFIGADSSFRLLFTMNKNRSIVISGKDGVCSVVERGELLRSIQDALTCFLSDNANRLPKGAPALGDFEAARIRLNQAISSLDSGGLPAVPAQRLRRRKFPKKSQ